MHLPRRHLLQAGAAGLFGLSLPQLLARGAEEGLAADRRRLMEREYYILWYRLDAADCYLIWYSDDRDGFVVRDDRSVPLFHNRVALLEYASEIGIRIEANDFAVLTDLDVVEHRLHADDDLAEIDCDSFLNAWNLFTDLSRSVGSSFDSDRQRTADIYDKLFWGCNLPAVTPPGERYEPTWNETEFMILRDVLGFGLTMLRSCVRATEDA